MRFVYALPICGQQTRSQPYLALFFDEMLWLTRGSFVLRHVFSLRLKPCAAAPLVVLLWEPHFIQ